MSDAHAQKILIMPLVILRLMQLNLPVKEVAMPIPLSRNGPGQVESPRERVLHRTTEEVYIPPTIRPDGLSRAWQMPFHFIQWCYTAGLICVDMV